MAKIKPANILLEKHLAELGIAFESEFQFATGRKWRFDYILIHVPPTAIEIEGGVFGSYDKVGRWTAAQGRHNRATGYEQDLVKYNHGVALGWRIFRFSTNQILKGEARAFLKEHLL